jgi:ketosteroid isomerase-like protein
MPSSARDVFEEMRHSWFGRPGPLTGELLAEDVVVETPFAPPGHPRRQVGRQQFLDAVNPRRAAFPIRIVDVRVTTVHDTADPDTIVVEYELTGRSTTTDREATAAFVGVLTVREGRIALWREYQDTLAIQAALT